MDIEFSVYQQPSTNPSIPQNIASLLIPTITVLDTLCEARGLESVDDVVPRILLVLVTAEIGVLLDGTVLEVSVVESVVVFGALTKNQLAATGVPDPVPATKLVRLKPTRLSMEAVKLLKNGT